VQAAKVYQVKQQFLSLLDLQREQEKESWT